MDRLQDYRVWLSVLLLGVVTVVSASGARAAVARTAFAEGEAEPCEVKDLGPCVPWTRHVYPTWQCHGIDCYSAIEFCCLPTLIFTIPSAPK